MDRRMKMAAAGAVAAMGLGALALASCGGTDEPTPSPDPTPAPAELAKPARPAGPLPALLISQAQFDTIDGKLTPGPAKLTIYRTDGKGNWWDEIIEDENSNVFHKATPWRDGILTIAAGQNVEKGEAPKPAQLRHWTHGEEGWTAKTLWERAWDGKYQRLRDIELGDLTGDGKDEMAIATHDQGVVAVATEGADGAWTVIEMDEKADTFVHEIEIGDVDGDGKNEFYATPSARNKASGESQPGGVVRYDFVDGAYVRSEVAHWEVSHAKEILVYDVNGDGTDELYVVREGHVTGKGASQKLVEPVKIIRLDLDAGKWKEVEVAVIEDEMCRFLVPGDVNHDGKTDLIAAAKKKGLILLELGEDGAFTTTTIDKKSSGFEHATNVADLDGDGKLEIYVASDDQRQLRKYEWTGASFGREVVAEIPQGKQKHITWNVQGAKL